MADPVDRPSKLPMLSAKKGDIETWTFLLAVALYVFGMWAHIPYGGGHIYSDIISVFQDRFCAAGTCNIAFPYLHVFVEYPVITGVFIYLMGMLGQYFPLSASHNILESYYYWTALFLVFPTLLSIGELFKIGNILGLKSLRRRVIIYFVATPSFVFMVLTNWYILGVFFTLLGLRKFLEGSRWASGVLLGISAATNLITAVPALGMLLSVRNRREASEFVVGGLAAFTAVYAPIYALNPSFISQFLSYESGWYAEGSWMLALFSSGNPLRHVLFPIAFILLSGWIIYKGLRIRGRLATTTGQDWANFVVYLGSLFSFAWLFSSYISTPQTNLMLLPFFVLLPMTRYFPEFLAFDGATSLIDVWGFSQPLVIIGITLHPVMFGSPYHSPIQALEVIRSIWIGKFLIYDGLLSGRISSVLPDINAIKPR